MDTNSTLIACAPNDCSVVDLELLSRALRLWGCCGSTKGSQGQVAGLSIRVESLDLLLLGSTFIETLLGS